MRFSRRLIYLSWWIGVYQTVEFSFQPFSRISPGTDYGYFWRICKRFNLILENLNFPTKKILHKTFSFISEVTGWPIPLEAVHWYTPACCLWTSTNDSRGPFWTWIPDGRIPSWGKLFRIKFDVWDLKYLPSSTIVLLAVDSHWLDIRTRLDRLFWWWSARLEGWSVCLVALEYTKIVSKHLSMHPSFWSKQNFSQKCLH